MPTLLDFDELILKVRSPAARAHVGDALAAFRAGALRPAVVATWTAVVFDVMAKVREIELTGDARARQQVERFDRIREQGDVDGSLAMERTLLEVARDDFELLTPHEYLDLQRLREDRHRCAHPAMNTAEDLYQPTAEQVRYHLASAFTHLLIQPPVQGKAALARLLAEVESPLFPTTVDGALRVLRGGPLLRPKDALVRAFVLATVKATLRGQLAADGGFVARAGAALAAAAHMHPALVHRIYADGLAPILAGLSDDEVPRVLRFGIAVPWAWEHMPDSVRAKLERLVATLDVPAAPRLFFEAAETEALRTHVAERAAVLGIDDLKALTKHDSTHAARTPSIRTRAVDLLVASGSWDFSNALVETVLRDYAPFLGEGDVVRIADAAVENVEVRGAFGTHGLLRAVRDAGAVPTERLLDILYARDLVMSYPSLLDDVDGALWERASGDAHPISVGDRIRHPTRGDGVVTAVGEDRTVGGDSISIQFENGPARPTSLVRSLVRLDLIDGGATPPSDGDGT